MFAWISEQTAIISLYSINLFVYITEAESVYCAVRTGSLNLTDAVSSLRGRSRIMEGRRLKFISGYIEMACCCERANKSTKSIKTEKS